MCGNRYTYAYGKCAILPTKAWLTELLAPHGIHSQNYQMNEYIKKQRNDMSCAVVKKRQPHYHSRSVTTLNETKFGYLLCASAREKNVSVKFRRQKTTHRNLLANERKRSQYRYKIAVIIILKYLYYINIRI